MGGGVKEPEALVFGAELRCEYGSLRNYLLTEDFASKGINGLPAKFVVTDCKPGVNIMPFGNCLDGDSCESKCVLDDRWINSDGQNETFGGEEIITTASHLVCRAVGAFILPVNSGQNSDIGKQLMLLAELDAELLEFIMNPHNSIYWPNDISQRVLDMLDDIINSDLYGGTIFLMAQGGHDIMGPIILASIGHLAPSIGVGNPSSLLAGMENMISRTGIRTDADPRNLDAETLAILREDSRWYGGRVANGGFYRWQEENKALAAFLADAVTTAAYGAIMYSSMTAGRSHQRVSPQSNTPRVGTGSGVPKAPKPGSLSDVRARRWYLNSEAKIPRLIDKTQPLKQQAQQASALRNQFRTQARDAMSNRAKADALSGSKPNMTWEQVVEKYTKMGLSGDELYQEIIRASMRSDLFTNESLGVFPR